jgi:hypothetical protein
MSDDKKQVEPGVDPIAPTFKEWLVKVYGVQPIESKLRDDSYMVLATTTTGRPVIGCIDDYTDLSNVVLYEVLGYAEGAVQGPDGKPAIGGQLGPLFHTIGVIKQTIMALSSLYVFDARSIRDIQLVHDYEENLKHIVAHYSGIQLATADQMPKGGPLGIIK